MAFVYERLEKLHKDSGERAIDFSRAIFGQKSKLGLEYFKGKTSISTAHLEKICLHFNVPMTYFFTGPIIVDSHADNIVTHNKVGVGNLNINNNVNYLQDVIETQKSQLASKDAEITWLRSQMETVLLALKGTASAAQKK